MGQVEKKRRDRGKRRRRTKRTKRMCGQKGRFLSEREAGGRKAKLERFRVGGRVRRAERSHRESEPGDHCAPCMLIAICPEFLWDLTLIPVISSICYVWYIRRIYLFISHSSAAYSFWRLHGCVYLSLQSVKFLQLSSTVLS